MGKHSLWITGPNSVAFSPPGIRAAQQIVLAAPTQQVPGTRPPKSWFGLLPPETVFCYILAHGDSVQLCSHEIRPKLLSLIAQ